MWVYLLKSKYDTFTKFRNYKLLVENQDGKIVRALRTNNGLEFCNEILTHIAMKIESLDIGL